MNPLIPLLSTAVLLIGLAAPQAAQSSPEVKDGQYWSTGGDVICLGICADSASTNGGVLIQGVDSTGISSVAAGVGTTPTSCSNSQQFDTSGHSYRIMGGKMFRKNAKGKWVQMKRVKKPRHSGSGVILGNEVGSLPQ